MHLGRRSRRILGATGAVAKDLPRLKVAANKAVQKLWTSMHGVQVVVWLDNWFRKRYGTNPQHSGMCLNVSAMAVLHIERIPVFPGYLSFSEVLDGINVIVKRVVSSSPRLHGGIQTITSEDLRQEWVRVPLDVQRTQMRSLQWLPYVLTEESVGSQVQLLGILDSLQLLQNHTQRCTPLLVDMDPHYRIMKLIYGSSNAGFDFARNMALTPVLYGVCHGGL